MTTIGDCLHSAKPFQVAMLLENMQVLVTWMKYQILTSDAYEGCRVRSGNDEYPLNPNEGGEVSPQMLFKEPTNIGEQLLFAAGMSKFVCFIEWWMNQPAPSDRDDDGLAWFDTDSIVDMWNAYLLEE